MFTNIGIPGLLIILGIVLLILGPKRLPGVGRSLGSSMREFKDSISRKSDSEEETEDAPRIASTPAAGTEPHGEPRPEPAKTPGADGDAAAERRL